MDSEAKLAQAETKLAQAKAELAQAKAELDKVKPDDVADAEERVEKATTVTEKKQAKAALRLAEEAALKDSQYAGLSQLIIEFRKAVAHAQARVNAALQGAQ